MTREEAITIIDNLHLIGCGHNQHEDDLKINVALDMAIKALEDIERWRTWSHTYDNLISRRDAIDAIERNAYRHTYLDQIIGIVNSLPSADRPTG